MASSRVKLDFEQLSFDVQDYTHHSDPTHQAQYAAKSPVLELLGKTSELHEGFRFLSKKGNQFHSFSFVRAFLSSARREPLLLAQELWTDKSWMRKEKI